MKWTNTLFLVPLLLCTTAQAAPPVGAFEALPPSAQEKQAPTVLASASSNDVFAMGGIGFAGTRPAKLVAYQAILRRPDATLVFQKLLASPSAVTRLYALTGIAKSSPTVFRQIAPKYQNRREVVKMMGGCIAFERPFGDAVRDLAAGESPATFPSKSKPRG